MTTLARVALALLLASGSSVLAQAPAQASNPALAVDAALKPLFPAGDPGGAVIIAKSGKTVFAKAYGMADIERHLKANADSLFRIGSMTKQFTAAAIMMLEEDGRLSVADDVTKYVPEVPPTLPATTIEHLLTHTSGLVNYTEMSAFDGVVAKDVTPEEAIRFFANEPREFAPGTQYRYSNTNYLLLGVIVERVSGLPYHQFLAKRIFEPLNMSSTAYEGYERNGRTRVEGYSRAIGQPFRKAKPISMTWPGGAGALVSTVNDLAKWNAAMANRVLLTPQSWARMTTPARLADGSFTNYGYGFIIAEMDGRLAISHAGGIPGFASIGVYFPAEQVYIAVLLNATGATFSTAYVFQTVMAAYFSN